MSLALPDPVPGVSRSPVGDLPRRATALSLPPLTGTGLGGAAAKRGVASALLSPTTLMAEVPVSPSAVMTPGGVAGGVAREASIVPPPTTGLPLPPMSESDNYSPWRPLLDRLLRTFILLHQ